VNGGAALYRVYATRDGEHIALAGQEEKFVVNLLTALGRPDLVALCEGGPGAHQRPVVDFLDATFRQKTRDEWDAWLAQLDVCYGPVKSMAEALEDANALTRGMVFTGADGRRHLGPPIRFRHEPAQPSLHEPDLGEHTSTLLPR
jgi:crotonobetainyl-CoA:carnitine CoA-transferase CaiB-like acyl-CoA transferase